MLFFRESSTKSVKIQVKQKGKKQKIECSFKLSAPVFQLRKLPALL
jgi:hypothetical protein